MDQDFFTNLPTEIMSDIVLRLPTQSIMSCKCVCKSWRDLIKTRDFVESHSSRSVPCLALFQRETRIFKEYKIIEFVDSQNSWQNHYNVSLNFSFPHQTILHSSANGLLLLINTTQKNFICNPITREYIELPFLIKNCITNCFDVLGFGASKLTGEYKVVRLLYSYDRVMYHPCGCEVYSLRRGLWRSLETAGDQLQYVQRMSLAVFSNGNLHWLVAPFFDMIERLLCLDLETECFSTFSIPHLSLTVSLSLRSMCALGDSLCLCDYNSLDGSFVIWLMKKYGDDKSWTKEFVIKAQCPNDLCGHVVPIKVFEDGDILFVKQHYSSELYYYSSKSKTIRVSDAVESFIKVGGTCVYRPSFLPLKTLTMKNNVISF